MAAGLAGTEPQAFAQRWPAKLDMVLAKAAGSTDTGLQQIIIRVRPGARSRVKDQLEASGYRVTGEHPTIDSLVVEVPSAAIAHLAGNP